MYTISTGVFASILALALSLAVVVQANGPRPVCIQPYHAPAGTTCDAMYKIFQETFNLTQSEVQSMNPQTVKICGGGGATLPAETWCVKTTTPRCAGTDSASGNTCYDLVSKWGISKSLFYDYNDDVNEECNNLVKDQKYCIRVPT